MDHRPLLSICIPTYERPGLLQKTLRSIISQKIDRDIYEICISDNSASNAVEIMMAEFDQENIIYKHIKPVGSYMNLIRALEMGRGKYLKLLNDYSCISDGGLRTLIETLQKENDSQSVISWTNGENEEYDGNSLDSFLCTLGINTTWAICFGIWKEDFSRIHAYLKMNEMFPHVSMLFENIKSKSRYIINNTRIINNQELAKKGGYNIPEVFGKQYISMVSKLYQEEHICKETLNVQKREALKFVAGWKALCKGYPEKYSFDFENDSEIIRQTFGKLGLIQYWCIFGVSLIKETIKKRILKRYP